MCIVHGTILLVVTFVSGLENACIRSIPVSYARLSSLFYLEKKNAVSRYSIVVGPLEVYV